MCAHVCVCVCVQSVWPDSSGVTLTTVSGSDIFILSDQTHIKGCETISYPECRIQIVDLKPSSVLTPALPFQYCRNMHRRKTLPFPGTNTENCPISCAFSFVVRAVQLQPSVMASVIIPILL